jgi:hypothetical protein
MRPGTNKRNKRNKRNVPVDGPQFTPLHPRVGGEEQTFRLGGQQGRNEAGAEKTWGTTAVPFAQIKDHGCPGGGPVRAPQFVALRGGGKGGGGGGEEGGGGGKTKEEREGGKRRRKEVAMSA